MITEKTSSLNKGKVTSQSLARGPVLRPIVETPWPVQGAVHSNQDCSPSQSSSGAAKSAHVDFDSLPIYLKNIGVLLDFSGILPKPGFKRNLELMKYITKENGNGVLITKGSWLFQWILALQIFTDL